jgi:predicted SprT family Zn-dependent metalloprotease
MNLEAAKALALQHMEAQGLLAGGWTFTFNNATRCFGICQVGFKAGVRFRRIGLSRSLTRLNTEAHVLDTILHEVAHALVGVEANHGPLWQARARLLGATPEACYEAKEVRMPYRWEGVCTKCQTVRARVMRPRKTIQSCGKCSPRVFNPECKLQWRFAPEGMEQPELAAK